MTNKYININMKANVWKWVKEHISIGITPNTETRKPKEYWKRAMLKIRFKF